MDPPGSHYNVVALVSDGDGSLSRGEVARQYSWSPYGQLLRADIYDTSAPMSRLGHQGLFHDRLDADILSEPMVAFARQAVQNRNRTLLPWLGRFAQRDPNASASGALSELATHGALMAAAVESASAEAMFGDGMSLHGYLRQQPVDRQDPLGLFFFGDVSMANDIAADLNADIFDVGMDVFDQIFDTFGIDIDGGSGFIQAGVFFGGFTKGGIGGKARAGKAVGSVPGKARSMLSHLRSNNYKPKAGYKGGATFHNREGRLPTGGSYKEFDVDPKPKSGPRNAERLVIDVRSGKAWYTADHYASFIPLN